MVSTSTKYRFV